MTDAEREAFRDDQNLLIMRYKPLAICFGMASLELLLRDQLHVHAPQIAFAIAALAVGCLWAYPNYRNLGKLDELERSYADPPSGSPLTCG